MQSAIIIINPALASANLSPEATLVALILLGVVMVACVVSAIVTRIANAINQKRYAKMIASKTCKGITKAGYQCSAIVIDADETTCKTHRKQSA